MKHWNFIWPESQRIVASSSILEPASPVETRYSKLQSTLFRWATPLCSCSYSWLTMAGTCYLLLSVLALAITFGEIELPKMPYSDHSHVIKFASMSVILDLKRVNPGMWGPFQITLALPKTACCRYIFLQFYTKRSQPFVLPSSPFFTWRCLRPYDWWPFNIQ